MLVIHIFVFVVAAAQQFSTIIGEKRKENTNCGQFVACFNLVHIFICHMAAMQHYFLFYFLITSIFVCLSLIYVYVFGCELMFVFLCVWCVRVNFVCLSGIQRTKLLKKIHYFELNVVRVTVNCKNNKINVLQLHLQYWFF